MRRVLIIGPCGAGKSTLARRVAERKSLPLHHLDAMFWSAGWVMRERGEFIALLENALKGDAWVIEGTYVSSLTQRMVRADQLIYLDFPTWLCLWRLLKRLVKWRGKTRADMAAGCPERFDWEFFRYALRFRRDVRPQIEELLAEGDSCEVIRLCGAGEVSVWLENLGG